MQSSGTIMGHVLLMACCTNELECARAGGKKTSLVPGDTNSVEGLVSFRLKLMGCYLFESI